MKNCLVVFPLYKQLNPLELQFLENGLQKTADFDHAIIAPHKLEIDSSFGKLSELNVIRFDNFYFDSLFGYNQLLLNTKFYNQFTDYEYILIHQSDVFLFDTNLDEWCKKGYDYIGAPWFRPEKSRSNLLKNWISNLKSTLIHHKKFAQRHNKCGNGGLSLRKVSSAITLLESCPKELLSRYYHLDKISYNEDIFWSLEAPEILKSFKIPGLHEGLQFAFEFNPTQAFELKSNQLPFGCHAPLKHEPHFWSKYIPNFKNYVAKNRIFINVAFYCIDANS